MSHVIVVNRPVSVAVGVTTTPIVVAGASVTAIRDGQLSRNVLVRDERQTVVDRDRPRTIDTGGKQGVQGPVGPPGPAGSGAMPPIDFAFGDATPAVVLVLGEALEFVTVSLQIEEAFDGAGASVALGIAGQPELLMPAAYNDPSTLGVYDAGPRVELPTGTQIILTITPGAGASAGRGQFVLTAVPID